MQLLKVDRELRRTIHQRLGRKGLVNSFKQTKASALLCDAKLKNNLITLGIGNLNRVEIQHLLKINRNILRRSKDLTDLIITQDLQSVTSSHCKQRFLRKRLEHSCEPIRLHLASSTIFGFQSDRLAQYLGKPTRWGQGEADVAIAVALERQALQLSSILRNHTHRELITLCSTVDEILISKEAQVRDLRRATFVNSLLNKFGKLLLRSGQKHRRIVGIGNVQRQGGNDLFTALIYGGNREHVGTHGCIGRRQDFQISARLTGEGMNHAVGSGELLASAIEQTIAVHTLPRGEIHQHGLLGILEAHIKPQQGFRCLITNSPTNAQAIRRRTGLHAQAIATHEHIIKQR